MSGALCFFFFSAPNLNRCAHAHMYESAQSPFQVLIPCSRDHGSCKQSSLKRRQKNSDQPDCSHMRSPGADVADRMPFQREQCGRPRRPEEHLSCPKLMSSTSIAPRAAGLGVGREALGCLSRPGVRDSFNALAFCARRWHRRSDPDGRVSPGAGADAPEVRPEGRGEMTEGTQARRAPRSLQRCARGYRTFSAGDLCCSVGCTELCCNILHCVAT